MIAKLRTEDAKIAVPSIIKSVKRLVSMTRTALMPVVERIVVAKIAAIPNFKNASKLVIRPR
jgi:hypothetical protein